MLNISARIVRAKSCNDILSVKYSCRASAGKQYWVVGVVGVAFSVFIVYKNKKSVSGCCSITRCYANMYSITARRHLHGYIISICVCWIQLQRVIERCKCTAIFLTCKIFRCFLFLFSNYFYNHLKISVYKYSFLVLYFWFLGCKTVKKAILPPQKNVFRYCVFGIVKICCTFAPKNGSVSDVGKSEGLFKYHLFARF